MRWWSLAASSPSRLGRVLTVLIWAAAAYLLLWVLTG